MKDINLYFVRHGETEWNILQLMQGSKNSPLTKNGIEGAKITGRFLAKTPFIGAYSSTQQRAIDTRDYILAEHDKALLPVPCFEDRDFCEMDFGIWEGHPFTELRPQVNFQRYLNSPKEFDATETQGENYLDVLARMQHGLKNILAKYDQGNVLIVSHGTALRILLHVLGGGEWSDHRDETISPKILNTSISIVNFKQASANIAGIFTVQQYNDVSHL